MNRTFSFPTVRSYQGQQGVSINNPAVHSLENSSITNLPLSFGKVKTNSSGSTLESAHNKVNPLLGAISDMSSSSEGLPHQARRVWVKKRDGNPTTLIVHSSDIVDDLKSAIINKFPTSLAKIVDPADLLIRMDLQARRSNNINVHRKALNNAGTSISPDSSRHTASPFTSSNGYGLVNLEPDQNVFLLLDSYYANGMSMQEAFIIEIPESIEPSNIQANTYNSSTISSHNLGIPTPGSQQTSLFLPNNQQFFYQPKPKYPHKESGDFTKEVSPSYFNSKTSPIPNAEMHRRAKSNPPQSPVSSSKKGSVSNQAVLLLPKNFSLASGGISNNSQSSSKKRLSLDDSFVRKNSELASPMSPLSSNATNIGKDLDFPMNSESSLKSLNSIDQVLPLLGVSAEHVSAEQASNSDFNSNNNSERESITGGTKGENKSFDNPSFEKVSLSRPPGDLSRHEEHNDKSLEKKVKEHNPDKVKDSPTIILKEPLPKVGNPATDKVLPSISVLVVEDNAINQAILGVFLRKHKIHYKIAKNGQEAVDKWREGGFHLVLMDIQLPVKSGIEATKEIRHLEEVNKIGVFAQNELTNNKFSSPHKLKDSEKLDLNVFRSPVIIVALTASSNSSVDKKNALTAGCNDYLTKPVNLVWLQNKITEWGCMQALIDFDGWKNRRIPVTFTSAINEKPSHKTNSTVKA